MYKYLIVGDVPLLDTKIPMIFKAIESLTKIPSSLYADLEGVRMMMVNELGWSVYVDLVEKTDNEYVLLDVWRDYQ